MKKEDKKEYKKAVSTFFPPCLRFVMITSLLAILVSLLFGNWFGTTQATMGKLIFWNVEYFFVLALCMELLGWVKSFSMKQILLTGGLYAVSFSMVWLSVNYDVLNFWMLGVLLLGYLIPTEMAIALHIILTISYCVVNGRSVEEFICYFTFGTLILLLAEFLDKIKNAIAIVIIAVTTNLAFLILLHDFALEFSQELVYGLMSTAVMILFLYGIQVYFDPGKQKKAVLNETLMKQLKEFSDNIYEHCILVGGISQGAAQVIGARKDLAYVAGCYHEVGRMEGKDYVANGEKMLMEHGISQTVIEVMKEHNMNHGKPASKEAAIVMLSDSIATTLQYLHLKHPDKQVKLEELVPSIIGKRFEQGLLKESGLSMEEMNQLKDYYIQSFQGK